MTIRDLRMPPSLGDTTGRVTSLAPPKEPEGGMQGAYVGGGLLQNEKFILQVDIPKFKVVQGGHTENTGMEASQRFPPIHTCTHIPLLSGRRRLTFAIRSTKNDGTSLVAVVIF